MTDRQFSHYVVSVSGKKGLGPWLVDDGDEGIHIVNDLASASPPHAHPPATWRDRLWRGGVGQGRGESGGAFS